MQLTLFHAAEGSCFLLKSRDQKHMLCNGGTAASMRQVTRKNLSDLVGESGELDYVYVSHSDKCRLEGVQQLLEDALEWKRFDQLRKSGDRFTKQPAVPKPPKINGILHNQFSDQLSMDTEKAEKLLLKFVEILRAAANPDFEAALFKAHNTALALSQAQRISYLCEEKLLNIPQNKLPGTKRNKKILCGKSKGNDLVSFDVGTITITLLSPNKKDIKEVQERWEKWQSKFNIEKVYEQIRQQITQRLNKFERGRASKTPFDLSDWHGMPELDASAPDPVASLVFLFEEAGKRIILMGDVTPAVLMKGLEKLPDYSKEDGLHVDVLKFPHPSCENYLHEFPENLTADHYLMCGDGTAGQPAKTVVDRIVNSPTKNKSRKIWLSTHVDHLPIDSPRHKHMKELTAYIQNQCEVKSNKLEYEVIEDEFLTLDL